MDLPASPPPPPYPGAASARHLDLGVLEEAARERMAPGVHDFVAGGADDEVTLADNLAAWDRVRLRPHVLRDVGVVDPATTLLGAPVATPVGAAPTAFQRMAHPDGEVAAARGAATVGALHVLATRASCTPAECATAAPGAPRWFQVYVLRDRARTERFVRAARDAGCTALVLTGDTPLLGRRLRDVRNRLVLPAEILGWSEALDEGEGDEVIAQDPTIDLATIGWLADLSGLPVVVKGVVRGDDARACVDAGAAAVWVSNHGGRQLDGCVATADVLPEVVAAVGGEAEVYVDGGVRRGTDVLKALALGARAAFVGRPLVWGLASGGADGAAAVLGAITAELVRAMALCGARTVGELTPDLVAAAR